MLRQHRIRINQSGTGWDTQVGLTPDILSAKDPRLDRDNLCTFCHRLDALLSQGHCVGCQDVSARERPPGVRTGTVTA